jgi:hypothetical protein
MGSCCLLDCVGSDGLTIGALDHELELLGTGHGVRFLETMFDVGHANEKLSWLSDLR